MFVQYFHSMFFSINHLICIFLFFHDELLSMFVFSLWKNNNSELGNYEVPSHGFFYCFFKMN